MTFTIVARCPRSGELGIAVSSAVPAVGALCPYIRPGIGAVTTQSWVNPYLAIDTLARIEKGAGAREALDAGLAGDEARELRQVAVVDADGSAAAFTGGGCTDWRGQVEGEGFAVLGNMLAGAAILDAMVAAFERTGPLALAERLLLTLEAGQGAGGDKRGRQSAGLKVFAAEDYALVDLRVDEHAHPVAELRRVFTIAEAQLRPFVKGMPRRGEPAGALPEAVSAMLLTPPPYRPGGGGSHG